VRLSEVDALDGTVLMRSSTDYAALVMKTNYLGVMNVTSALLPHFRARRTGKVIIIGSRTAFRNEFLVGTHSDAWLYRR
jgi:NADP-dependent 3-hydroxy acid dehydrogenase YdfG